MKLPRMANAVGHMDDDLIGAAANHRKNRWVPWVSLAACFAVLFTVGTLLSNKKVETPGNNTDRYKDFTITGDDSAIVWPWDYQSIYEQYTELEVDGVIYRGKGRTVSASLVGNLIGEHFVNGYDEIHDGEKHTKEFEVYTLKNVDQSQFLAVKMDGAYYVFKNNEYAPPGTLGALMELVDLPTVIELRRFSENGDSVSNKHFQLNDDKYIWSVLADCKDAVFVEDEPGKDSFSVYDREYLSFTVTSETLGVYKVALYVTVDGYLWTNAFHYQYLFHIGEDAAGKIIKYAKKNATEADYEPYTNFVAGTITAITDDYILIDDSVLCVDPTDGITYKILLNDLRISRCVDHGIIKAGDTVQVTYEGELPGDNTLSHALSVSEVIITDNDLLILD